VTILGLLLDGSKFRYQEWCSEWHRGYDRETSPFPNAKIRREVQEDVHRVIRYCVSRHAERFPGGRVKNGELAGEDDEHT
jgi:hypothetical protein